MRLATIVVLTLALGAVGCTRNLTHVQAPGSSRAIVTAPPWLSTIYLMRTDSGIVVFDLGWYGASRALRRELARWGADPDDVTDVFLTHSHRDHIAAWRVVPHARFHMAAAEVPLFEGRLEHRDLPSRLALRVLGASGPPPDALRVIGFSRDTSFVLGRDTLHAFLVPGHTTGSTAYLFRDVLFTGDATVHTYGFGAGPSMRLFTAEVRRSRSSLAHLRDRVRGRAVEWVCTAHAKCARASERYWRKVLRDARL